MSLPLFCTHCGLRLDRSIAGSGACTCFDDVHYSRRLDRFDAHTGARLDGGGVVPSVLASSLADGERDGAFLGPRVDDVTPTGPVWMPCGCSARSVWRLVG